MISELNTLFDSKYYLLQNQYLAIAIGHSDSSIQAEQYYLTG